ncbi:NADPH-dependent F420 reductase [Glycomyces luteolus]|uniref:NADPH-dependent F420 reductase n=1 Tax=Glycomyces luteolus TaxID=2670330 RepID=A0A9X3ST63_9ACTN|nr:NADPH-dependent F420 reductase [Glycomyces luteolus]MDA1359908.1 NADPH-dependent F420 reductase [Glycomyces luteolus]
MEVLIVGAGGMARGIGLRLVRGGHQVRIAHREPDKAADLAAELGDNASGEPLDSAAGAQVVILALPYEGSKEIAEVWADRLAGKIIVDISNPVDYETFDRLVTPPGKSATDEIAEAAPGAKVVKAFNTTFASRLATTGKLDVFIAGDDGDARKQIASLCTDADLRPIDVGGRKHAATLEAMQLLHMKVQGEINGNWSTALTFAP